MRRGLVTPIEARIADQGYQAQRNFYSQVIIGRSGLNQAYLLVRVFAQAAGKATAGGSTANDDVIEIHQAAVQPPSILRLWPVTIAEISDAR